MEAKSEASAAKRNILGRVAVFGLLAIVGVAIYFLFGDRLTLDAVAEQEEFLRTYQSDHPVLVYVIAFFVYVSITGLSLPGATALTLVYAWYFGFFPAVVLVSFASTTGATTAFLLSRYLFREGIEKKFGAHLSRFDDALEREGAFYLFTLRLIPAVPFFVINVVMGLTRIGTATFWWVSQVGMLAGTMVYVYAGSTIPSLSHLADASQLRSADVLDWERLEAIMRGEDGASAPGSRIRELLSDETKGLVDALTGEPDEVAKMQLVRELNSLMTRSDFALDPRWSVALEPSGKDARQRRAAAKRLTQTNRSILVAAYPKIISPPRPILSKQLILAFVILGVFPLIAKRLMQRFRKTPGEDQTTTEAGQ